MEIQFLKQIDGFIFTFSLKKNSIFDVDFCMREIPSIFIFDCLVQRWGQCTIDGTNGGGYWKEWSAVFEVFSLWSKNCCVEKLVSLKRNQSTQKLFLACGAGKVRLLAASAVSVWKHQNYLDCRCRLLWSMKVAKSNKYSKKGKRFALCWRKREKLTVKW